MEITGTVGSNIEIREVSFETVLPVWKDSLWPGRVSAIEPISCIGFDGQIDISIQNYQGHFFGAYARSELVGVISCHPVTSDMMRLRGIFVKSGNRGQQVGEKLIQKVKDAARQAGMRLVFGLVRERNQSYFEKNGFHFRKKVIGYEFGPHVIMVWEIL